MTGYVELPSDHEFTAFLAGLTPSKVLRDREAGLSREERKRARFLREPRPRGRPRKPLAPEFEATVQRLEQAIEVLGKQGARWGGKKVASE